MAAPLVPLGELGTSPFGAGSSGTGKPASVPAVPVVVASPVLSWLTNPGPYTVAKVQGVTSPGRILLGDVQGFERVEKWDKKAGKGTTGATSTHVGGELAEGSMTFTLPDEQAIAAWASYLALFRFDTSKGKGEAVSIYHPMLASVQPPITSVVMTGHTPVVPQADGSGKVTIKLLEYGQAKATGATTAAGSKGYAQGNGKSTGTQEDPAIAKLRKQADDLNKQLQGTP